MNQESYIFPIQEIGTVNETSDIDEVNQLIRSGWMLLIVVNKASGNMFVLGKPRAKN